MTTQVRLRNLKGDIAYVLTAEDELPDSIHVLSTCGPEAVMRNTPMVNGTVIAQAPCEVRIFDRARLALGTQTTDPCYQEIEQEGVRERFLELREDQLDNDEKASL